MIFIWFSHYTAGDRQYQNQNLHNRAALLGDYRDDRPGSAGSGRFTPTRFGALSSDQNGQVEGSYSVKMDDGHLDYLESQNEEKIHGLSAKVAILKNVRRRLRLLLSHIRWSTNPPRR